MRAPQFMKENESEKRKGNVGKRKESKEDLNSTVGGRHEMREKELRKEMFE